MATRKVHKRKKLSRARRTGTHYGGARKKRKKSGHRGGSGMAGTGKRGDQKKTLVLKLYGHDYFGKQGITSKKTEKDKRKRINLQDISLNLKKYADAKGIIQLGEYKILGKGEVKEKLTIKAKEASQSAIDKIKKAGGEIILPAKKEKPKVPKKIADEEQ